MIGGGPEGGIYKTTNGGKTWTKLTDGLPKGDMGRVGLAIDGRKTSGNGVRADRRQRDARRASIAPTTRATTWTRIGKMAAAAGGGGGAGGRGGGAAGAAQAGTRSGAATEQLVHRRRIASTTTRSSSTRTARHDLLGEHQPRTQHRRRQDVGRAPNWENTGVHVDHHAIDVRPRATRTTSCSATTAASTRRTTTARRGGSSPTCRSPSTTACRSTTRSRSTTSAAAPRTTGRTAARRARSTAGASARATGSSSPAETASSRAATPRIPTSSTPRRRTAASRASIVRTGAVAVASARRSRAGPATEEENDQQGGRLRRRRGGGSSRETASTGTRPTSSARTTPTRLYWASNYLYATDDRGDTGTVISGDLSRNLDRRRDADHGQGVARRLGRAQRLDDALSATSCRSTSPRCSRA